MDDYQKLNLNFLEEKIRSNDLLNDLFLACHSNDRKRIMELLNKKRMLDLIKIRDKNGRCLIHYCAECDNHLCILILVQTWPHLLFDQDNDGYTVLHLSIINAFQKFLNCTDNEGHSPFHWATVCHDLTCLDILSQSGACPCIPDVHGAHPLHYAAQMTSPFNAINKDTKSGLVVLKKLLTFPDVDPNCKDRDQRTPLLWAASSGSSEAILLLIKAGANIASKEKDGLTALHCAASRGHIDCLETLVNLCGADIDLLDSMGCSALFYSVTLGQADCTQFLLENGSEPNLQDLKGRTAAHCGAYKGQFETLKILYNNGANLWIKNARGDLPLHEAIKSGRKDLVRWLLQLYPSTVNDENSIGRTPLHIASMSNNLEMCKILIDSGAKVNPVMEIKGHLLTPLDAALYKGYRNGAKFLLLHGALPANKLNLAYKFSSHKLSSKVKSKLVTPSFCDPDDSFQSRDRLTFSPEVENASDNLIDDIEKKKKKLSKHEMEASNSENISDFGTGIKSQSIITNVYVNTLSKDKEVLTFQQHKKTDKDLQHLNNQTFSDSYQAEINLIKLDNDQASDKIINHLNESEMTDGSSSNELVIKKTIKPLKGLSKDFKSKISEKKLFKKLSTLKPLDKKTSSLKKLESIQKENQIDLKKDFKIETKNEMKKLDEKMLKQNGKENNFTFKENKMKLSKSKKSSTKKKNVDLKHEIEQNQVNSKNNTNAEVKQMNGESYQDQNTRVSKTHKLDRSKRTTKCQNRKSKLQLQVSNNKSNDLEPKNVLNKKALKSNNESPIREKFKKVESKNDMMEQNSFYHYSSKNPNQDMLEADSDLKFKSDLNMGNQKEINGQIINKEKIIEKINTLVEKSPSLNNLTNNVIQETDKFQQSLNSTSSLNSRGLSSFGESLQSIQFSDLDYSNSSLAHLSGDDLAQQENNALNLRNQTKIISKNYTLPKLINVPNSKLKSVSKCGHRLHHKSNLCEIGAIDVSHVTAKVDTKGHQIYHNIPTHSKQKFQTSLEKGEIFQNAEKGIQKYEAERKLFEELKQLKRYQIRTGRVEEPTMAKRLVERFRKEIRIPGMGDFSGSYTYKEYEKFLYNELRKLSWSNQGKVLPLLKATSNDDIALDYIKKLENGQLNKVIQRSEKRSVSSMSGFDPFFSKDNPNKALFVNDCLKKNENLNFYNSNELNFSFKENNDSIFPIFGPVSNINVKHGIEERSSKSKNFLPKLQLDKSYQKLSENKKTIGGEKTKGGVKKIINLKENEATNFLNNGTTAKYEQFKKLNQTQRRTCLKPKLIIKPLDSALKRPKFKRFKSYIPIKHQLDIPIKEIEKRWRLIKAESKKKLKLNNSNPEISSKKEEFDLIYEINIPSENDDNNGFNSDTEKWIPMTIYRVQSDPLPLYRLYTP